MRSINKGLITACSLCVLVAILVASQQLTSKRITTWTHGEAYLKTTTWDELATLGPAISNELRLGAPPPTLAELLDRIDQRQRPYLPLLNSGSDWWETPFHYEVQPLGIDGSHLIIRSYGANRKNDGGNGDDVERDWVFLKR